MNTQSVQVSNSSKENSILIKFTPPENATIPDKSSLSISPGSIARIDANGGVMNMFIWGKNLGSNNDSDLIWKGVVPTKINKMLVIDPEGKKVFYDGIELPDNFQPTTSPQSGVVPQKDNSWTYFIVSLIIVLLFVGVFLSFKKRIF